MPSSEMIRQLHIAEHAAFKELDIRLITDLKDAIHLGKSGILHHSWH